MEAPNQSCRGGRDKQSYHVALVHAVALQRMLRCGVNTNKTSGEDVSSASLCLSRGWSPESMVMHSERPAFDVPEMCTRERDLVCRYLLRSMHSAASFEDVLHRAAGSMEVWRVVVWFVANAQAINKLWIRNIVAVVLASGCFLVLMHRNCARNKTTTLLPTSAYGAKRRRHQTPSCRGSTDATNVGKRNLGQSTVPSC